MKCLAAKEFVRNLMVKQVNRAFFSVWTPAMAYVLGYWFADGWMSQPDSNRVVGFVSKDLEHLHNIQQAMEAEQKIRLRNDGCYQFVIGSKQMWSDLFKLGGCPAKSLIVDMPFVSQYMIRHFIRGFVDGDGTLYRETSQRRRPMLVMIGGVLFLEKLACILDEEAGVGIAVVRRYSYKTPCLMYSGIKAKTLAKWLYTDADLVLERKAKIAREFASWELSKFGWKSKAVMTDKMCQILES
jgi:hypothetical protein